MHVKSIIAAGTLVLALGALPLQAQQQGTSSNPNMPAAGAADQGAQGSAGAQDNQTTRGDRGTIGTAGQGNDATTGANGADDQGNLPDTASPLALLLLSGFAALGGASALRRARQ